MRRHSAKRRRAHRDDHELLEVDRVVGVRAAVEHVHHRHRQDVGADPVAAEVAVQRQARLQPRPRAPPPARRRGSRWRRGATCSACRRARSATRSIPPGRARRARDSAVGDLPVDVARPPSRRPCRPTRVAAVAQLGRLELAGRGARRHRRAPDARPPSKVDLDLDRRVAPRVEDLAARERSRSGSFGSLRWRPRRGRACA